MEPDRTSLQVEPQSAPSKLESGSPDVPGIEDDPGSAPRPQGPLSTMARVPWLHRDAQSLRFLAAVAIPAAAMGYGISPALRGWATGIGRWIAWADLVAAVLSQLLAVWGVMLVMRLGLATVKERRLPAVNRLIAAPAATVVLLLSVLASKTDLSPLLALGGAAASSMLALASAAQALRSARTRALGMALASIGLAALIQVCVRWMALEASRARDAELFDTARALATLGFLLMIAALAIAGAWLLSKSGHRVLGAVGAIAVCGATAWMADRGSTYGASGPLLLLGRTLTEMMRQPSPLVLPVLRHAVEALGFIAAVAAVAWPGRDHPIQAALALLVLTGAEADIPAFSLMLTLAALTAGLVSTTSEPGQAIARAAWFGWHPASRRGPRDGAAPA